MITSKTGNPKKLLGIQALRFSAALTILLYHGWAASYRILNYNFLYGFFRYGYYAVDFFFVLSGFVIYFSYGEYIGKSKKFKSFLLKRLIRIYPFYWFLNLIFIPIYFAMPSYGSGAEKQISVIVNSLFLIPQAQDVIIYPAWTLSYIVFFYLIFSMTLLLKKPIAQVLVRIWVGINAIVLICLAFNINVYQNYALRFVFSYYHAEFILGAFMVHLVKTYSLNKRKALLGIGIILLALSFYNGSSLDNFKRVIFFGTSFALIIGSIASWDIHMKLSIPAVFNYLGDASYAIFLSHYMIIAIVIRGSIMLGLNQCINLGTLMVLSSLTALISGLALHSFVEKPLATLFNRPISTPRS